MNLHFSHVGFTFSKTLFKLNIKRFDNLHKDKFYAWVDMKVAEIF